MRTDDSSTMNSIHQKIFFCFPSVIRSCAPPCQKVATVDIHLQCLHFNNLPPLWGKSLSHRTLLWGHKIKPRRMLINTQSLLANCNSNDWQIVNTQHIPALLHQQTLRFEAFLNSPIAARRGDECSTCFVYDSGWNVNLPGFSESRTRSFLRASVRATNYTFGCEWNEPRQTVAGCRNGCVWRTIYFAVLRDSPHSDLIGQFDGMSVDPRGSWIMICIMLIKISQCTGYFRLTIERGLVFDPDFGGRRARSALWNWRF